jgi:hypothetical protein
MIGLALTAYGLISFWRDMQGVQSNILAAYDQPPQARIVSVTTRSQANP